eukprot:TRINITY_DN3712_c1_g1_i1.p1 TRINITY_DN3712_c1_g1~~TRINITY_DN3712_c1_g1_i1.p1  ORF type:complete len:374 (-),score=67.55 TRINITY_DN3712_c1_g1_i1:26-1147(-)
MNEGIEMDPQSDNRQDTRTQLKPHQLEQFHHPSMMIGENSSLAQTIGFPTMLESFAAVSAPNPVDYLHDPPQSFAPLMHHHIQESTFYVNPQQMISETQMSGETNSDPRIANEHHTSGNTLMALSRQSRHDDQDCRQLTVFWDVDKCPLPDGVNPTRVMEALRGFAGDLGCDLKSITGIERTLESDPISLPNRISDQLRASGEDLSSISDDPRSCESSMLNELFKFIVENPPPHWVLIVSDIDISMLVNVMRDRQYSVFLAHTSASVGKMHIELSDGSYQWNEFIQNGGRSLRRSEPIEECLRADPLPDQIFIRDRDRRETEPTFNESITMQPDLTSSHCDETNESTNEERHFQLEERSQKKQKTKKKNKIIL